MAFPDKLIGPITQKYGVISDRQRAMAEVRRVRVDPNEDLANIRLLVHKNTLEPREVEQLIGLVAGLDNWLGSGGYLPKDWAPAVGLASKREKPEMREYLTQTGTLVQAILLPGGAAIVTWRPGTDDEYVSRETEHWVDNEVKHGWLIPFTKDNP